jgi:ubiquinone/menaquinone biosynthesis C-methylase UbiE
MFYKGEKLQGPINSHSDLQGLGPQVRKELANRFSSNDVNVLDVGTGSAGNVKFLGRCLSKRSRIWTLDPSQEVLEEAKRTLAAKRLSHRIEFVRASANETGLKSGFFDYAVSVMALHHIEELRPSIVEMMRVLKEHGRIILVDYRPEAADELHFATRHNKADFFVSSAVADILRDEGEAVVTYDFNLWYLVEATKPAAD